MFATLLGPLPRPPLADDAAPEAILDSVLQLQVEHGLEPVTDAGWGVDPRAGAGPDPVAAWRTTQSRADRLAKAVLLGPFTSGSSGAAERRQALELAEAGCAWIEIHEPAAVAIGTDPTARARFANLHRDLTAGLDGVHLSLVITGGNADAAGVATILAGAYASLGLDLIEGPDNWRLAVAAPGDRGIVCGALSAREESRDGPETLIWAAGYAASTGGRGLARVGLATSGSLGALPWDAAATKVRRLGEAARLVEATPDERRAGVDPRAVDLRSAALGRADPPLRRRRPSGEV